MVDSIPSLECSLANRATARNRAHPCYQSAANANSAGSGRLLKLSEISDTKSWADCVNSRAASTLRDWEQGPPRPIRCSWHAADGCRSESWRRPTASQNILDSPQSRRSICSSACLEADRLQMQAGCAKLFEPLVKCSVGVSSRTLLSGDFGIQLAGFLPDLVARLDDQSRDRHSAGWRAGNGRSGRRRPCRPQPLDGLTAQPKLLSERLLRINADQKTTAGR